MILPLPERYGKFKINTIKNKELTKGEILKLGWIEKNIEGWKGSIITYFEKDNFTLTIYEANEIPILNLRCKDPCLISWMPDPEQFRVTIKCPTVEYFKIITSLIGINYEQKDD